MAPEKTTKNVKTTQPATKESKDSKLRAQSTLTKGTTKTAPVATKVATKVNKVSEPSKATKTETPTKSQKKAGLWTAKSAEKAAQNCTFVRVDMNKSGISYVVFNERTLESFKKWRDGKNGEKDEAPLMYILNDPKGKPIRLAVADADNLRHALSDSGYKDKSIDRLLADAITWENFDEAVMMEEIAARNSFKYQENIPMPLLDIIHAGDPKAFKGAKVHGPDGSEKTMRRDKNEKTVTEGGAKKNRTNFATQLRQALDSLNEFLYPGKKASKGKSPGKKYVNIDNLHADGSGAKIGGGANIAKLTFMTGDEPAKKGYYPIVCSTQKNIDLARKLIEAAPISTWKKADDKDFLLENLTKLVDQFNTKKSRRAQTNSEEEGTDSDNQEESDAEEESAEDSEDEAAEPTPAASKRAAAKTKAAPAPPAKTPAKAKPAAKTAPAKAKPATKAKPAAKKTKQAPVPEPEAEEVSEEEVEETENVEEEEEAKEVSKSDSPVAKGTSPVRRRRDKGQ